MKWWAIYTNLPVKIKDRVPHSWNAWSIDSLIQEIFLAYFADKQIRNYDTHCLRHHRSISTLTSKGLRHSKIKWWMIYTNLSVNDVVGLPHPRRGDSLRQEAFVALPADKKTGKYDTEYWDCHLYLSTLRPKGLSLRKVKWWVIYTNLPLKAIVRLPHPRSGVTQG